MLPLPPQWVFLRRRWRLLRMRYAQGWRPLHWPGMRRTRRALVTASILVVFAACLGGAWAMVLSRSAPGWWVTVRREDPEVIRCARVIENRIMSRAQQDRAGGAAPWTVEIPANDANAWLNVRLPLWLANQKDQFHWPREMSDLQVNFADDQITIGARVRAGQRDQVLTATIEPRLADDGRLFIPARWIGLGRLPIPAQWVLDEAHRNAERYIPQNLRTLPETESLFKAFSGDQAIRNTPVFRLMDGRKVRILAFSARNDRLRLTCRTEQR
jgi:hypothetical protein